MSSGDGKPTWQQVEACRQLIQVHDALVRLRPPESADALRRRNYHLRSAAAYERISDIDRGHHHEALYWAQRERKHADACLSDAARKPTGGAPANKQH